MTPEQKRKRLILMQKQAGGFPAAPAGGSSTNSQAVGEFSSKMRAMGRGALQGLSFNARDEAAGADAAILGITRNEDGSRNWFDYSDSWKERLQGATEYQRQQDGAARQAEPLSYGAGQIAGATVPALAATPLGVGRTALQTGAMGAGVGAVEGGLIGAGASNGQDMAKEAAQGAALGAGLGAAAPLAVGGANAVRRAVSDPVTGVIDSMVGRASQSKANRAISRAVSDSGQSHDDIASAVMKAAQEGQSEFRMMDALGLSGQRQASGLTRAGGDAGNEIAEYLQQRQAGQADRIGNFVDEGFGMGGQTAAQTTDTMKAARAAEADVNYSAARGNAAPVDVRGALSAIDARTAGMSGSNVTGDGIDAKLNRFRGRLAVDPAPNGEISRELSDFDRVLGVKQDVQDEIGAAIRAGRNNEARELGKLVAELDAALEQSSNAYRSANDQFRTASQSIDAVEQGAAMTRPASRAADNVQAFSSMTPDQQTAARSGYGDKIMAQLEAATAPTTNRAKPLQSPKMTEQANAMSVDPALLRNRLDRETQMWETQNRALGGSRTADNLQDLDQTSEIAGGIGGAAKSALNFQFGDAASQLGGVLSPFAKGNNDATRKLIAQALMSGDPQKVLEPALRQEMLGKGTLRSIEAMLRQALREPAQSALTE